MELTPLVAIVIPVFNRLEETISCLKSLGKLTYENYLIIIVDDGSEDGTSEYIKNYYQEVYLIKGDGNQWYSGSMNLGIRKAIDLNSDYVLFLNNDNTVSPDFLTSLINTSANLCDKTIVCSLVAYNRLMKNFRFGGGKFSRITGIPVAFGKEYINSMIKKGKPYKTDYAGGMGVLLSKNQINDIGYLDYNSFPMCGDGELWLRATREKGYRMVIDPSAHVFGSSGQGNIRNKPSIRQLIRSITNMRSGQYFKYIITNYYRYFPKPLLLYYIITFYIYYIFGGLILITRSYFQKNMKNN